MFWSEGCPLVQVMFRAKCYLGVFWCTKKNEHSNALLIIPNEMLNTKRVQDSNLKSCFFFCFSAKSIKGVFTLI